MRHGPDRKLAGLLVPVFAIRTENDLGVGDTEGIRQMIDWCARHGFGVLQVLPINETSDDNSPYNAISSLALDLTTIATAPQHLTDLTQNDIDSVADANTLSELRHGSVKYRQVKKLKQQLLRLAFENASKQLSAAGTKKRHFDSFKKANSWLKSYALFRVLIDENRTGNWESWPAAQRDHASTLNWLKKQTKEERDRLQQRMEYYTYVQWIAYQQWLDVRRYAEERNVALMGDIPFGVSRYSADVWANRELFDLNWSGGAPPEPAFGGDSFTRTWGQNWGVPLYRWDVHRERNFDWWRLRVKQISSIFHIFRIDHVLGFYRIYAFPWKPEDNRLFAELTEEEVEQKTSGLLPQFWPGPDDTEEQKETNCAQGEELLRIVMDAAGDTAVIAEDLGVVPDYVRPSLLKLGIPGFKIPHWERNKDYTYVDGATYPRLSVVTPSTHDHDPLVVLWRNLWKEHREAQATKDDHRIHVAWLELQRLIWWLGWDDRQIPTAFTPELHEAFCRRVMQSNAWIAIFMITDVFAQESRFNVPGAVADNNWSARLEKTVNELDQDPQLFGKVQMIGRLIEESGRKV